MKRASALFLVSILAPSVARAGIITGGEGITANSVVHKITTPAPNNAGDPGASPNLVCIESDKPPPGGDPSDPGYFSVYYRFHVASSGQATRYDFKEIVHNIGTIDFLQFHYSLGYFLNGCFHQYLGGDWVIFDYLQTPPTSTAFATSVQTPTMLGWKDGDFASGTTARFTFSVVVPDAPVGLPPSLLTDSGYDFYIQTCKSIPDPFGCPEPSTLAGLGIGVAAWLARRALAGRGRRRSIPPNIPPLPSLR